MEGIVVLILFLTFLVGGMMLALVMGYRDIEESRAQETAGSARAHAPSVVTIPSFFLKADYRSAPTAPVAFDEALFARLEQHVKAEHERVADFVHFPSIDRLYRESDSRLHVH